MEKIVKDKLPFIIITSIGIVVVFFFYGKIILAPNDHMFCNSGDGIKNYFTYAYHIKHDSAYTNFEGMNYPYGENYLFTDCQPILANTFKFLSSKVPFFKTHSIGLLNLLMILSILFTFIIIYLLLVELKLNKWISIFFSISISLLAPQLFRLSGHLALSYSTAIPLSWLIILKCVQNPRRSFFVLLFINNLFWMLIHAYLGIIISSYLLSILLVKILSDNKKKDFLSDYIWLGIVIITPIVLFYFYTVVTDTHVGRTNNPSGFFLYNAELDDVFIPHGKPFRPLLDKLTGGIIKLEWEAGGYVGMVNSLFFLVLLFITGISFFKKSTRTLLKNIFNNRFLNISLIAAFIVLLFALAIPFKQFPRLLELLPVFKQFRATGRFVWPFYFAFTAFAAYVFQEKIILKFNDKKRRIVGIVFLFLITGISCTEAYHYHIHVSESITKTPNLFNTELLPEDFRKAIDSINPNDYQAIISFPFYYLGSESYSRPVNDEAVRNSLVFSYHTGIPNVCTILARTSIEESKRIIQILSPNYYKKEIINDFSSTKPFLIIKTGNRFTQYESAIIEKGKKIYKNYEFELLQIRIEDLFSDDSKKLIEDFQEKLPDLFTQESYYVSNPGSILYYDSFENSKSTISFRGQGCFKSVKKGKNTFAEFPPNTFEQEKEYDISLWMYNGEPDALNLWFRVIVEEYDEINNKWYSTTFFPEHAEVICENWSLVEGVFSIQDSKNWVYIVSKGKENSKASLHVDDIVIKEKNIDMYKIDKEDSTLFFNNHNVSIR